MSAILSVTTVRAHDGKTTETMTTLTTVKAHFERLGAKARIVQQAYGPNANTVSVISEHADWNAFGAFSAKVAADAAFQAMMTDVRANPTSSIVQRSVSIEL